MTYIGNGFTGADPAPVKTYGQLITDATRTRCTSFIQYLNANGLDALSAGLQALPHNNADYISQYQQLSVDDRELVGECARFAAAEILSQSWEQMSPEEQLAHNKWINERLEEETRGKPGVAVTCPPGTPPAECAKKIHAAVDAAECKGGFSFKAGPVPVCVPAWLVWGGAALGALIVFNTLRGGRR